MAGIGFELKKILNKDTFLSEFTAYLYAAMVSSGPWLISVFCLAFLGLFRGWGLSTTEHEVFRSTVVYTYALSLIFIGFIQLVATRYLADRLYLGDVNCTLGTFFTCNVIVLAIGSLLATGLYWNFELSFAYRSVAVVLFLLVCLIWLAMIFLSTVKDYPSIVMGFALGALLSIAAAIGLWKHFGKEGFLVGYTIGQALIFFWLTARLLTEFEPGPLWDHGLVSYFSKYADLLVIGAAWNLGIWVDKFVFWSAPDARMIIPWFFTHDMYEGPVFFAYLSIVPSLAVFLIKIETGFYTHYTNYYAKIISKQSLSKILEEKVFMVQMLKESIRDVLVLQGAVTTLCIIFAPQLLGAARMIPLQIPLFRVSLIGAFLQVSLSMVVIILFYFDLRKRVLIVTLFFLAANGGLSFLTTRLGFQFYGYGYCYACFLSLLVGYILLTRSLKELEFITFAQQPLA